MPGWPHASLLQVMAAILHEPLHGQHLLDAGVSAECIALLASLLERDPLRRITVDEALGHPWFAMHASGCGCESATVPSNNIVAFEGRPAEDPERLSALGIWAMMQGALRGHPTIV